VENVPDIDKQARTYAMLAHILGFATFVFPLGNILGPLIVWLIKKDEYPFVNDQGKEALNFQISFLIYGAASALLIFAIVGIALAPAVFVCWVVFTIVAAVNANDGKAYRYPLTIRFIK